MKLTLRIATSILTIIGIVMIIVGAVAYELQITSYIAIGVLLLAFGVAGFVAVSAIGQEIDLGKNKDTTEEENNEIE